MLEIMEKPHGKFQQPPLSQQDPPADPPGTSSGALRVGVKIGELSW
jgi:hypothetical protein